MKVVVVYAHPSHDSFARVVRDTATKVLSAGGHSVTLFSLYEEHFVAALSPEEWRAYTTDSPIIDPIVRRHADAIVDADALVFIYPTWWSGLPSILKGWCERVLVLGVAFTFNDNAKVRPALQNIKHIIGISTYGSPHSYIRLINDNGRRVILRALRISTGRRTRTQWLGLYGIAQLTNSDRQAFLNRVENKLSTLK